MIRINLLSDREAVFKETSRKEISIFFLTILLLFVILGGVHFQLHQKKSGLEADIQEVNRVLKELEEKVGKVEEYKAAKKELETKLVVIEKLQAGQMWVPRMLNNLGELIQEKMWLEKLNLRGNRLSMEGYAIDHETIANFMKDLDFSPFFDSVELELTEKRQVEGIGMKYFSLVTAVDPGSTKIMGMEDRGTDTSPKIKSGHSFKERE